VVNTFATLPLDSGYCRCTHEPCLFARQTVTEKPMLCVYVDDIITAALDAATLEKTVDLQRTKYQIKDLSAPSEILGWKIHKVKNGLLPNQNKFVARILLKYLDNHCHSVCTPMLSQVVSALPGEAIVLKNITNSNYKPKPLS
jgi:Reverse transcriptase (RNA-dependent DNA polymerase)